MTGFKEKEQKSEVHIEVKEDVSAPSKSDSRESSSPDEQLDGQESSSLEGQKEAGCSAIRSALARSEPPLNLVVPDVLCGPEPVPSVSAPDFQERFQVLERIGEGGMGVVYKVFDPALGKALAVKVLHQRLVSDKQALKRFEQEAKAAAKLNHPNLVSVYRHDVLSDGTPYLVMDYVEGENLAQALVTLRRFEPRRALELFRQILDALDHAHEAGLLHRDIKPRNIILTKDERGVEKVKLVDFGIAKVMSLSGGTTYGVTQTGEFLGSPLYMSPEQCQGEELDARADIYSAGCLLYEMLTGQALFSSNNPVKIVVAHLTEKPPLLSAVLPTSTLASDLDCLFSKCLAKRAGDRYQSVAELRNEVESLLAGESPSIERSKFEKAAIGWANMLIVIAITLTLFALVSPQTFDPLWTMYVILKPYSFALLALSVVSCIALSIPMSRARERGEGIQERPWLTRFWLGSYLFGIFTFSMLPSLPFDGPVVPYVVALAGSLVASLYFFLRYRSKTKGEFLSPFNNVYGRVLSEEERLPLRIWRRFVLSATICLALWYKAPQYVFTPYIAPVVVMVPLFVGFCFLSERVARRLRSKNGMKPGDKWLLLAGISGGAASFLFAVVASLNLLASLQLIPVGLPEAARGLMGPFVLAPGLISLVFFFVWGTRKKTVAPFGKTDGW